MDSSQTSPNTTPPKFAINTDASETVYSTSIPEEFPSRQTRLLQSRNARFSAKRLSITSIGSRIAQRKRTEGRQSEGLTMRDKENINFPLQPSDLEVSKDVSPIAQRTQRLQGVDSSLAGMASPKDNSPSTADQPERKRKLQKRHSSPLIYQSSPGNRRSPAPSTISSDSTKSNRLREVSGNEIRNFYTGNSSVPKFQPKVRKQTSMQLKHKFDADDYIEHIENELQQAREELKQPAFQKSLRHQLKTAQSENDRLRQELADMRNAFETDFRSTIEQRATSEAELQRKVKVLEGELMGKVSMIQDLEYQHEDKRLDNNTLDTLKATIERLEAEKLSMEEENKSITKRNEVLSELLAMSPTKSRPGFELRSPTREKRPGRPMSLIIPKVPSSPTEGPRQSLTTSPQMSSPLASAPNSFTLAEILPLSLEATNPQSDTHSSIIAIKHRKSTRNSRANSKSTSAASISDPNSSPLVEPLLFPMPSSPVHGSLPKPGFKRKPRRFMHGSTQLKPLLLPTLRADTSGQSSASGIGSPGSISSADHFPTTWEPVSYFDLEAAPLSSTNRAGSEVTSETTQRSTPRLQDRGSQYQTVDEIIAEHCRNFISQGELSEDDANGSVSGGDDHPLTGPGPTLTGAQFIPTQHARSTDTGKYPSRGFQYHTPQQSHTHQCCIAHAQQYSSPINIERLNTVDLDLVDGQASSMNDVYGKARVLSAVPRPLFSSTLRQTADNMSTAQVAQKADNGIGMDFSQDKIQSGLACGAGSIPPLPVKALTRPFGSLGGVPNGEYTHSSPSCQDGLFAGLKPSEVQLAGTLRRSMTPLELLQRKQFGARPLAAFTIRTICTALSRCTTFVRDVKSNPLALARKVLANAWFANWKRFGRLAWWVLGIFLPQRIHKTLPRWDWDDFDAEMIAERCCDETLTEDQSREISRFHDARLSGSVHHHHGDRVTVCGATDEDTDIEPKPGWCKSVFLWGKFSIAIMLAVGGAVVKGPAEMLRDIDHSSLRRVYQSSQHRSPSGCTCSGNDFRNYHTQTDHLNGKRSRRYPTYQELRSRTQAARAFRQNDVQIQRDCDSSPHLLFENDKHHSALPSSDGEDSPVNEQTLRPAKTRKKHVRTVFEQPQTRSAPSSMIDYERRWSQDYSISDGFLKWPPDFASTHSDADEE